MALTWKIQTKLNGVLTDADALPTITVSSNANGNILFFNQTMNKDSTGVYSWPQPSEIPGQSYHGQWDASINNVPINDGYDQTSGADAWYYSDRAGVATVLDAATIAVTWDLDDANGEDAGVMLADGITADGYIDLYLANEGVSVPVNLTTAAAHIVKALADVSNHMTVWYGWTHRGLQELSSKLQGRSADDLAGLMSGYKTYADEQLEKIASVLLGSHNGTPAATGMLSVIVGPPKQYPGTGCARPVTRQLPNLNGIASW